MFFWVDMDQDKQDKYELMNPIILSKRIHQLEDWNDQLNAASHDRINVLKDEIHLMKQDHYKIVEDLSTRVQNMTKKCVNISKRFNWELIIFVLPLT